VSEKPMNDSQVAVITDIHANLPALEATLAHIEEMGFERIYCGGDLVGYGPHPNASPQPTSTPQLRHSTRSRSFTISSESRRGMRLGR
jgi:hypothetical protein